MRARGILRGERQGRAFSLAVAGAEGELEDGFVPAAPAAQAGEAGRRQPTREVGSKRALGEAGQRGAGLFPAGAKEFREVLADDPVEGCFLRAMALVVAGQRC